MCDPMTELLDHLDAIFAKAEHEGLYVGMGYEPSLLRNQQEGPMIKRLRKLMEQARNAGVAAHQQERRGAAALSLPHNTKAKP